MYVIFYFLGGLHSDMQPIYEKHIPKFVEILF